MRQKNVKMAICAVTAILTFSGMNIEANAATDLASVLPSAGVDYTLQANATSLKNIKEETAPVILKLMDETKDYFRTSIYKEMVLVLDRIN